MTQSDLDAQIDERARLVAELTAPHGEFELIERTVRGIPMRVYSTAPATLRDVFLASEAFGQSTFLVYESERTSFAEHFRIAAGFSRMLWEEYGLGPGDRMAVSMRNYPEWAPVFWAAQAIGVMVVPINAWWNGEEIRYALADSGARLLVADAERVALLAPDYAGLPVIEVRGGTPAAGIRAWADVVAGLDPHPRPPEVPIDPDDDATILYTSGTTGRPKGAVGSHRNHCTNLWNTVLGMQVGLRLAGVASEQDSSQRHGPQQADAQPGTLVTFPMFHIAGITGLCLTTLIGAKLATLYRGDRDRAIELIRTERLTSVSGVPTMMRELVAGAAERVGELPSLTGISIGGTPVPPDLINRIDRTFDSLVAPSNGYGLTETTSAVVSNSGAGYVRHPDSVGRCMPGADLLIVDTATGDALPDGEVGELWFRGPNVVRGYWNNPEATAAAFVDGWFRTGDLGYQRDGWVYAVDRIKDVVIRGGENVYCAEVEAVLFEHPDVADAAVVGVPHEALGERVAAVVHVRSGAGLTAEALREHTSARLAAFKTPEHVVLASEPLPRTATGKVLKRQLRDELTGQR